MKKDDYIYPAIFTYDEHGISIEFPDLPGCLSCAQNDEQAFYMSKDAMRGWLLVSEEYQDEISPPTSLNDIVLESNQKVVLVEVCLALYRHPFKNKSIKKTITIPQWLDEKARAEGINFSGFLQQSLIDHFNA